MLLKIHYNTQMLEIVPLEPSLVGRVVSKPPKRNFINTFVITTFFLPWVPIFSIIPPLLPLSLQTPLDHVNELCRP
jgi:hypothetical protein